MQNYRLIAILCNFTNISSNIFLAVSIKILYPTSHLVSMYVFVTVRSTVTKNIWCYTQYVSQIIDRQGQGDALSCI